MNPSDVLNSTLAGAIAWLISFGISAAVSYVSEWFPEVPEVVRKAVTTVAVAMLVAGATAVASMIPQQYMDMRLIDVAFALLSLLVAGAGLRFGSTKAILHMAEHIAALASFKVDLDGDGKVG